MDLHPNKRCIFIEYKNTNSKNVHTINGETTPDCIMFKPAKAYTNIAKAHRRYAQSDVNLRGSENLKTSPNNIDDAKRDNSNIKTTTADSFETNTPLTRRYILVENVTDGEVKNISGAKNMRQTKYKDRVTYCHPTRRRYSQEFVEKTLDTNVKLHQLLKNLVQDTEKGDKKEMWDNYIKELENKHGYNLKSSKIAVQVTGSCGEKVNVYAKDFDVRTIYENRNESAPRTGVKLGSDSFCYPMSSQGRYMMLNNSGYPAKANIFPNQIFVKFKPSTGGCCKSCFGCSVRTRSTQLHEHDFGNCPGYIEKADIGLHTDSIDLTLVDCNECPAIQVPYDVRTPKSYNNGSNVYKNETASNWFDFVKEPKLLKSTQTSSHEVEQKPKSNDLASIDSKLSQLINCFNTLAQEIKAMKCPKVNKSTAMIQGEVTCVRVEQHDNVARFFGAASKKQDSIDTILCEEKIKSDSMKRLIDEIVTKNMGSLNTATRSGDYLDDIPTKEHATEVTESLYKANQEVKSELGKMRVVEGTEDRNMTIAVNTEPLGLSALIRISADTLRGLLSIWPSLDCYEYLSMMKFCPLTRYTEIGPRYACNICGATFHLPSELSAHIQLHNLGNVRNCCVCRKCIDSARNKSNLFPCQYCGQMFTRAYCRELHEQACALRMGIIHDVTPSRVLLT